MIAAKKTFSQLQVVAAASPPSSILASHFSSTSTSTSTSTTSSQLHQLSIPPPPPQQEEEKWRSVGVSVWWEVADCPVPKGVNPSTVSQSITAALRANGMNGPVRITALVDVHQLPKSTCDALASSGVIVNNMTYDDDPVKRSYLAVLSKLQSWASEISPPAHLLLITDRELGLELSRQRWKNYNVLLASSTPPHLGLLCCSASIVWRWDDLAKGEKLIGKYFNQPPDASWYGNYSVPLVDPLVDPECEHKLWD